MYKQMFIQLPEMQKYLTSELVSNCYIAFVFLKNVDLSIFIVIDIKRYNMNLADIKVKVLKQNKSVLFTIFCCSTESEKLTRQKSEYTKFLLCKLQWP